MTFNWATLATLGILSATIHWIVARSKAMQWFWESPWLPTFVDDLLRCPACLGFWLGLGLGATGVRPLTTGHVWLDIVAAGLAGVWCTPIVESALLWGIDKASVH